MTLSCMPSHVAYGTLRKGGFDAEFSLPDVPGWRSEWSLTVHKQRVALLCDMALRVDTCACVRDECSVDGDGKTRSERTSKSSCSALLLALWSVSCSKVKIALAVHPVVS